MSEAPKKSKSGDDGRFHASRFWWGVALSFLGAGLYRAHWPARPNVPLRSPPFEWHYISGMFTNGTLRELDQMIRDQRSYATAAQDITAALAHIGEMRDASDPICKHPLMVADSTYTKCLLPQRVDIARHYLMTGGPDGYKEKYETMASRIQSFIGYLFDKLDTPSMKLMFQDPDYVARATNVCRGRSVFDPIQLNLILMLPGQVRNA